MSLQVNTTGREPSSIQIGWATFTVHYLHVEDKPKPDSPEWVAFALVLYDEHGRVYPAECFQIPKEQQPPGIDGFGSTHLEAYADLKQKLSGMTLGVEHDT